MTFFVLSHKIKNIIVDISMRKDITLFYNL